MRFTDRCAVCLSCLTLLASPASAGGALGRARVVTRRGVLFSFFSNNCSDLECLFVRILVDTCQSGCKYVGNWVVEQVALFPVHFWSTF